MVEYKACADKRRWARGEIAREKGNGDERRGEKRKREQKKIERAVIHIRNRDRYMLSYRKSLADVDGGGGGREGG